MLFLRTWRSACTCSRYHVCVTSSGASLCVDEESKNDRAFRRKYEPEKILEKTASDAAASGNRCTSRNVPLDKLLGFCDLFRSNLRSGTVYEYHRAEGKNQMGARSDCSAGSGNSDTGNGDHSAVYVTV